MVPDNAGGSGIHVLGVDHGFIDLSFGEPLFHSGKGCQEEGDVCAAFGLFQPFLQLFDWPHSSFLTSACNERHCSVVKITGDVDESHLYLDLSDYLAYGKLLYLTYSLSHQCTLSLHVC